MSEEVDRESMLSAVVPYFGAKRLLAGRIVEEVGDHRVWWEPFCGSLAVTLTKPPCSMETVNDLNADVTNLALVLADPEGAERFYERLLPIIPSQAIQQRANTRSELWAAGEEPSRVVGDPHVDRAVDFFVSSWLGRNGVIGTANVSNNFAARYTSNGGAPARRWKSAVESIPAWHERLRNVVVTNVDGIGVCERVEDKAGTAVYCDPPYLVKGSRYVHDFADADHDRLAAALRRLTRTRVVVSYYDHPRLAELYPGWRKVEVAVTKAMMSFVSRRASEGPVKAPEVLLCNW